MKTAVLVLFALSAASSALAQNSTCDRACLENTVDRFLDVFIKHDPALVSFARGPTTPWTWELAEMFKIENGKIHRIEAVLDRSPYGMPSGWSSPEDGRSD